MQQLNKNNFNGFNYFSDKINENFIKILNQHTLFSVTSTKILRFSPCGYLRTDTKPPYIILASVVVFLLLSPASLFEFGNWYPQVQDNGIAALLNFFPQSGHDVCPLGLRRKLPIRFIFTNLSERKMIIGFPNCGLRALGLALCRCWWWTRLWSFVLGSGWGGSDCWFKQLMLYSGLGWLLVKDKEQMLPQILLSYTRLSSWHKISFFI